MVLHLIECLSVSAYIYTILIASSFFRWVKIPGTELLPGDIVSIGRSTSGEDRSVPADMLLLAGSAIVNEAILTGESTPQWKVFFHFPLDLFN